MAGSTELTDYSLNPSFALCLSLWSGPYAQPEEYQSPSSDQGRYDDESKSGSVYTTASLASQKSLEALRRTFPI